MPLKFARQLGIIYRNLNTMFGLLLKAIPSCAVALCFTLGKAIYTYKLRHRPLRSVILNAALTSIIDSVSGLFIDSVFPDIDLSIEHGDGCLKVPLCALAESTANQILDSGVSSLASSYNISKLPSGISIAKTAVVDLSSGSPVYQGVINPEHNIGIQSIMLPEKPIFLKQIVLREILLKNQALKHFTLPNHIMK